jgi:hypothetical protein
VFAALGGTALFTNDPYSLTAAIVAVLWQFEEPWATYTQEGAPQRIANCQGADAFRQGLTAFYLDCAAGTFDLSASSRRTRDPLYFRGSDGGLLIGSVSLVPLVLTATTAEQREAICDLDAGLPRGPDWRLVNAVNNVLGTFVTA